MYYLFDAIIGIFAIIALITAIRAKKDNDEIKKSR